jgi:hypothetical protein
MRRKVTDLRVLFAEIAVRVTDVAVANAEVRRLLYGRKVRFKALLLNGIPRTGTIKSAIISDNRGPKRLGVSVEVAVDRMDGRPGVLGESWWGDLIALEVLDG